MLGLVCGCANPVAVTITVQAEFKPVLVIAAAVALTVAGTLAAGLPAVYDAPAVYAVGDAQELKVLVDVARLRLDELDNADDSDAKADEAEHHSDAD